MNVSREVGLPAHPTRSCLSSEQCYYFYFYPPYILSSSYSTTMPATEITHHTTASSPRPHILYNVRVKRADGGEDNFLRRYSDVRSPSPFLTHHLPLY